MIGRIAYFGELSPEQVKAHDRDVAERFFPAITSQPGIAALFLVQDAHGKRMSVSVWESEEALAEAERRAHAVPLLPGMRGEEIPSPERVEICGVKHAFLAPAFASQIPWRPSR